VQCNVAGRHDWSSVLLVLAAHASVGIAASTSTPRPSVQQIEAIYADAVDDAGVITTIDSGLFDTYRGRDLDWWKQRYSRQRRELAEHAARISTRRLSPDDARALRIMRGSLASTLPENPLFAASTLPAPTGHCGETSRTDIGAAALRDDMYACFDSLGNHLLFEGKVVSRDSAITLLGQIEEPARRKALFLAFAPLWEAVNGKDEPGSPYRRMIRTAAADAAAHGSGIEAAGRDLGLMPAQIEEWLTRILETWREVTPDSPVEPWDYRYVAGEGDRELTAAISAASLLPVTKRYFHDLGADLDGLGIIYDLESRAGKAPVTYANYVTMGRVVNGHWRPTLARVSASYSDSGLYVLNMLTHESGHTVHYAAIRNRPAFMDIGDDLFCESFADVTSWNVYDPAWQQKYLGHSVTERGGLRSQYTMVTLEVAWSLFELRMLHNPDADPNLVWTEITSRYFHVVPHPEYSWWVQRGQLVTTPGFMANYGLGAVVTADIRQRIRSSIGPFNTGNDRWYPWVSRNLLRSGLQFDTSVILRKFLGRPVSLEPLLTDIRRIPATAPISPR
jgi:hypothetical protein